MTKDVLIKISGLHTGEMGEDMAKDEDEISVTAPGLYYFRNGKHYVLYDEFLEDGSGIIKNRLKYKEGEYLEINKSGVTNAKLFFENGKINISNYQTPYGELMVGTYTKQMNSDISEEKMTINVSYQLDINDSKVADCDIHILVEAIEK